MCADVIQADSLPFQTNPNHKPNIASCRPTKKSKRERLADLSEVKNSKTDEISGSQRSHGNKTRKHKRSTELTKVKASVNSKYSQ